MSPNPIFFVLIYTICTVNCENYLFTKAEIRFTTDKRISRIEVKNVKSLNEELPFDVVSVNFNSVEGLTSLPKKAISDFKNLKEVGLVNCDINTISPGSFHNVPNLSTLKLQDNNLTTIVSGVFDNLNLVKLYLHRNFIQSIASDAFNDMPKLKVIKLNNNYLTQWESGWFKNCPNLVHIFIRRNELKSLPENAFANLKRSRENGLKIYLSKNTLSEIHPAALGNLTNIEELWLDRNKIKNLPEEVFSTVENIKALVLSKNKLKTVHKNQFPKLQSMKILDLTKNNLTCIPYDAVVNVKHVFLKKNKLNCDCVTKLRSKLKDNDKSRLLYPKC